MGGPQGDPGTASTRWTKMHAAMGSVAATFPACVPSHEPLETCMIGACVGEHENMLPEACVGEHTDSHVGTTSDAAKFASVHAAVGYNERLLNRRQCSVENLACDHTPLPL